MVKTRMYLVLSALIVLSLLVTSCAPAEVATPEPIIEEKEVQVTRIVAGTPVVETILVTATPVPKGGDALTFASLLDPETLDNTKTTSETVAWILSEFVLEGLIYYDKDGTIQGQLAESWEVSPDGKEITFTLRQGVKFHDGTEFNAEAVKFQFDRIMDPATASPALAYITTLTGVEVVDPYIVKFTFSSPDASFWVMLTYAYFQFNSPTAMQAAGDEYGRHPIGTGPFMFESWIPGSQLTFVKFPDYQQWRNDTINKGPALADKVIIYVIPEAGMIRAALKTGEILVSNLTADILPDFVSDPNFKITINKKGMSLQFLDFNNEKPPFDDVNFRKAISYAIDRKSIVTNSRGGYADEMLGFLAPGIPSFDPTIGETYGLAYDPEKARSLLAELGWVAGEDGILVKDGVRASYTIKCYSGFTYVIRSLEVIQQNLMDIGIEAEIELSDWSAFYPSLLEDDLEMDMMRWSWDDLGVMAVLWRSPGYRGHIPEDPELDSLLDNLQSAMDPVQRDELSRQAQKMLIDKMIAVPIQSNWIIYALRSNVQDYNLDFLGLPLIVDVWLSK